MLISDVGVDSRREITSAVLTTKARSSRILEVCALAARTSHIQTYSGIYYERKGLASHPLFSNFPCVSPRTSRRDDIQYHHAYFIIDAGKKKKTLRNQAYR